MNYCKFKVDIWINSWIIIYKLVLRMQNRLNLWILKCKVYYIVF
jgi:hypothetical protein